MKAIRYTLAAALTVIAAASCQDTIAPEQTENTVIFTATIDNEDTKAVMGNASTVDGKTHYPVYWSGTEKFSVFDTEGTNQEFVGYANDNPQTSISIKGTGSFKEIEMTSGNEYYALYPYNGNNSFNADTKVMTFRGDKPHQQYVDADHQNMPKVKGGQSLMFFAGKTTNNNFSFTHALAYIKFNITSTGIYNVAVKNVNKVGGTAAPIAASTHMTLAYETDNTLKVTNGNKVIATLYAGNNTDVYNTYFDPGTYYIAVIPVDIKIELQINADSSGNNYNVLNTGKTTFSLKPGMILNIGDVSLPAAEAAE